VHDGFEYTPLRGDGFTQAFAAATERVGASRLRNTSSQLMPLRRSSSISAGTSRISSLVLRASMPTAVRAYSVLALCTECEMKVLSSAAGMLSMQ
jgi:hypothetical protein